MRTEKNTIDNMEEEVVIFRTDLQLYTSAVYLSHDKLFISHTKDINKADTNTRKRAISFIEHYSKYTDISFTNTQLIPFCKYPKNDTMKTDTPTTFKTNCKECINCLTAIAQYEGREPLSRYYLVCKLTNTELPLGNFINPPNDCPLKKIERSSGEISFSIESDYGKD